MTTQPVVQQQPGQPQAYGQPQPQVYGQQQYGQPFYGQQQQVYTSQPYYGNRVAPMQVSVPLQPMPAPSRPANCPPGLEYLTILDQIIIQQEIDYLEMLTNIESNQRFRIRNSMGQRAYYAAEASDCCERYCCETLRSFKIYLTDNSGNTVALFHRPCRCNNCCCDGCQQILTVESPPGTPVAWVKEDYISCQPAFKIIDAEGKPVLRILGPPDFCCPRCLYNFEFQLQAMSGDRIGEITRNWPGFAVALFTDADCFTARFPTDLDVRCKLALMGATFLLDFMYFDRGGGFWS